MITQIHELISCCDQEITMREYHSSHQKIIRTGWAEFSIWVEQRGYGELNEFIVKEYCDEIIGIHKYSDLKERDKKRLRSVRMLLSYQKDGDFEFRIPTKQRLFRGSSGEAMQKYMNYLRDVLTLKETTMSNKRHYLHLFNEFLEIRGCSLEHLTAATISDFYQNQNLTLPMLHNCNSTTKAILQVCV